jgi:hypothetical protein
MIPNFRIKQGEYDNADRTKNNAKQGQRTQLGPDKKKNKGRVVVEVCERAVPGPDFEG